MVFVRCEWASKRSNFRFLIFHISRMLLHHKYFFRKTSKQECIPIVCATSALYRTGGGAVSLTEDSHCTETPPAQRPPPPVNRITDRCKNIILPQTFFAGAKYFVLLLFFRNLSKIRFSYVSGDNTSYSARAFFNVFAKHDVSYGILLTDVDECIYLKSVRY